ncbi:hypothetical protein LEP1GSC041_0889 [Leptospira noguchii str. 2006001870]|uniref:hypothetical protein n=1 Tax=Leptospira noguchii TaxID=28182 RepID=UPI0002489265|nr:hypothetical protein [Leptospira noguchii]EKR72061.1 hypothetical protein LEP1GSC041_0889 [Leptospira noguchii str. 2006001870]
MGFWKRLFSSKKNFRSAAKIWIEDPEKLQKSIHRILDLLFDSTLKELMPEKISFSLEPLSGVKIPEDKIRVILKEINIRETFVFRSTSDAMSLETQEAILKLAAGTVAAPSKFFLMKILNQSPIQEMFSLGLEKILLEFNKKLNPLAGMFQAAGFEKQVSGFLSTLLPGFTEKIAEMIHNSSESEAGKILISNTLKILFQTGFSDLGHLESSDFKKHLEELKEAISKDPILEKNLEKLYESFRDTILNEYRGETLKEFLGYSEKEYILFRDSISKTVTENILAIHKQKPLTELVAGLLEDILG